MLESLLVHTQNHNHSQDARVCPHTAPPTQVRTHTHTHCYHTHLVAQAHIQLSNSPFGLKWTGCVGTAQHGPPHLTKGHGHSSQDGITPLAQGEPALV